MKPPANRRLLTLVAGVAGVIALGVGTVFALPGDHPKTQRAGLTASYTPPTDTTTNIFTVVRQMTDYWTPERMLGAVSLDDTLSTLVPPATRAAPTELSAARNRHSVEPVAPTVPVQPAGPAAKNGSKTAVRTARSVGKVFFTNAQTGKDFVCSGAAMSSARKNVISTAGHCVHGGKGGDYHKNWVFVPGYRNGQAPYGKWAASRYTTFNDWTSKGDFDWDVAFVNAYPLDGHELTDVVGGNGIRTGQSTAVNATILGYPHARPFDGQRQAYCKGRTHRFGKGHSIEMSCNLTPGASGGPWLLSYSDSREVGYVNGISSNTDRYPNPRVIRSAYFGAPVWKLFQQVAG